MEVVREGNRKNFDLSRKDHFELAVRWPNFKPHLNLLISSEIKANTVSTCLKLETMTAL